ncbi:MAG: hypothetical protein PHZ25_02075 [Candidatus Pacebacteria bacterium]|nr:hypothetical protein [Candidatus Paceibacterota bacterium]
MLILAAMSDVGSFRTIFPVGVCLRKMGHEVKFQAFGNSIKLLKEKGEENQKIEGMVKGVVTGMSSDEFEYSIASVWRDKCSVITIPDQWSSPFFSGGWKKREKYPDAICVNDDLGREAVRAWGFNGLVVETGWPALDFYADRKKWKNRKQKMRERLELASILSKETKLIFFVGQGSKENTEAFQELLEVAVKIDLPIKIIAREHPNARRHNPEEAEFWEKTIRDNKNKNLLLEIPDSSFSSLEFLATADVVVSDFSTVLTEATILEKPTISILYPNKPVSENFRRWSWTSKTFPLAALGCCQTAENRSQLKKYLEQALTLDFQFKKQVEKKFRLDGKNSMRVAQVVENLAKCRF